MISLIIGILASAMILLIAVGTKNRWPTTKAKPKVTILLCARNEENTLFETLMSLATQDYPSDRYSLLLVDHLSEDSTGEIMDDFAEKSAINTKVIHIIEEDPKLKGKIHALDVGMSHVQTEFALMTDGDCIVPETWISSMMNYFRPDVVAVSGLVTVGKNGAPDSLIARLQHVDHRYYLGMLAGLSGLRAVKPNGKRPKEGLPNFMRRLLSKLRPSFCIGNNLAVRMSAYRQIGGYRTVGPSLIEDYSLMTELIAKTKKHLVLALDSDARIYTAPETNLRSLWQQKRRWSTATNRTNALSAILFIMIIAIRVVLPWMLFFEPIQALAMLILVGFCDGLVMRRVSNATGEHLSKRDIFAQELYQIILNHLLTIGIALRWPVIWKGKKYRI